MTIPSLFEFTPSGLVAFEKAFNGQIDEDAIDLSDISIARPIPGTAELETGPFATARQMAAAVLSAFGTRSPQELLVNTGLWAWLAFVLRESLYPRNAEGKRKLGEVHRWLPSNPNDFQKAQRHMVRMPVLLLATLGKNSDHLLCGLPSVPGELKEQLTSQQDMFHPSFQAVARALYYDEAKKGLKRGTGGKGGGSPRRLAKVRSQLDVTWDLFAVPAERLLDMLPKEFDRFKT